MSCVPAALKKTEATSASCPSSLASSSPVVESQILMVPSEEAEARRVPPGLKASEYCVDLGLFAVRGKPRDQAVGEAGGSGQDRHRLLTEATDPKGSLFIGLGGFGAASASISESPPEVSNDRHQPHLGSGNGRPGLVHHRPHERSASRQLDLDRRPGGELQRFLARSVAR